MRPNTYTHSGHKKANKLYMAYNKNPLLDGYFYVQFTKFSLI